MSEEETINLGMKTRATARIQFPERFVTLFIESLILCRFLRLFSLFEEPGRRLLRNSGIIIIIRHAAGENVN